MKVTNMKTIVPILLIFLCLSNYSASENCVGQDQCSCTFDTSKKKVDLTSLGKKDDTPRFHNVKSADLNTYSYNPCFPFNQDDCQNVAVCTVNSATGKSQDLGEQNGALFQYDGTDVTVSYNSSGGSFLKITQVVLKCDPKQCTPLLVADGSQGLSSYQLTMTTVCACPDGCTETGPVNCGGGGGGGGSGGIGGGSIILIVFFVVLVVYFVGGVLFMKFNRKATGAEIIPNVEFWRVIPGLIKAGFLFATRPCLHRGGYEKH